ncbi:Glutathione-independent formaldehyde dehydrogenase [Limosilactobacillus fermentum]|nr:Glutathione-independent formaldehyde dehydrogenase [Limosilactobacillus fermentum]SPE16911.1 Glutathione-independent formaldehyde dehydrogenase [Limosilactobacillus fermentum]
MTKMKAAVFMGPGKMEVHEVDRPTIEKPTDAVLKIVRACVCGSDLWWFRGISNRQTGTTTGHEAIGIVEEVGADVKAVKPGDFVVAPFTHSCGHCAVCLAGCEGNCFNMEAGGNGGYQGEYLRYTNADWSLVKIPG